MYIFRNFGFLTYSYTLLSVFKYLPRICSLHNVGIYMVNGH